MVMTIFTITLFNRCVSDKRIMSQTGFEVKLDPLPRADYMILQDAEGTGSASAFLFGIGNCINAAKENAMFEAISKIMGADMLIAPRYEIHSIGFLGIYKSVKVTVKAKAVQLKSDK